MLPFSLTVRCVTCEETFTVNDRSQCGTIVACPYCRAMVEVVATGDAPPILKSPDSVPLTLTPLSPKELQWRRRLFVTFITLTAILILLLLITLFIEPPQQIANNIPAEPKPQPELPAEIITEVTPEVIIPEIEHPVEVAEIIIIDPVVDDTIDHATDFVDRRDEIIARLDVKVASLDVSDVAAIDVARALAAVANVSVTVAPNIAERRITLNYAAPVSVAEIMQAVAKLLGNEVSCEVVVEWNQVSWRVPDIPDIKVSAQEETASGLFLGWDAMQQPCTLDVFAPMQLEDFLVVLERASGVRMLIDHAAVNAASSPAYMLSGTVSCDGVTLDAAIQAFLNSLDAAEPLTYRICGARLIEVTTVTASRCDAASTLELRKMRQRADTTADSGGVDSYPEELPTSDDSEVEEIIGEEIIP